MEPARIYLDHAASTPLHPEARAAIVEALGRTGNPSSPHAEGREAKDLLESARTRAAGALGCRPREIVFTGSGTIAAQLGLRGVARARRRVSQRIVISGVEHPAVAEAADDLAGGGFEVTRAGPDGSGRLDADAFLEAVGPKAGVAALMLANHETGTQMPVGRVTRRLRERGVPLLCDACLGPGRVPIAPDVIGADVLVLSAHKFNGPRGIGLLYVRRRTSLEPLWRGGLQEERLHPGTEAVAAAVGLAVALELAVAETAARAARYEALLGRLVGQLDGARPWHRVGPEDAALPGLLTLELPGVEGEAAMINLDLEGIAVSTGSACALGATDPSPSLLAMGFTRQRAASTIRLSIGEGVGENEIDRAARAVVGVARRLRALGKR